MDGAGSVHWRVSGRVQGVGFRWFVLRLARQLEIRGDVRNLPDGRVEIRAAGPEERLQELERHVRQGPRGARVDGVEVLPLPQPPDGEGFQIRH